MSGKAEKTKKRNGIGTSLIVYKNNKGSPLLPLLPLCRRWRFEGEVLEVDAEHHQIRFRMSLPLGIVGDNRIVCTPLDEGSCILRYG
jgi:hypothetical protein